jgi:predicted MFS family arabinose efflux permease
MLAEVLHSVASSMLGPCIAAITLGLVSAEELGERLGRNARFASLGCGVAAAVMGACGTYVSNRAVFWLTAALMLPAIGSLRLIGAGEVRAEAAGAKRASVRDGLALLLDRDVLAFSACAVLFHLANAAMLPLAASSVTREAGSNASLLVAACIILPQGVVALLSPWAGRMADRRGHRLVLALGFAAVPLRGVLLALVENRPELLVAVQLLDGVSATVFGIMLPLVAADLMRGTGRFNLCMGVFGLACTLGGTLSTLVAGLVADERGEVAAFLMLAGFGMLATLGTLVPRLHARQPATAPDPGPAPG